MAVDLHAGDTSIPSQFHPDEHGHDVLQPSPEYKLSNNNSNGSALIPQVVIPQDEFGSHGSSPAHSSEEQGKDKDEDCIAELTRRMAHFMLQDDDKFDFSGIGPDNLELSWDFIGSPQSTVWSSLGSNQGSPKGFSQEPSPQGTSWESTGVDVVRKLEKMKLDERDNSKFHPKGYEIQNLKTSNVGHWPYQTLIQDQIRAIQLSQLKQEQVLFLKQKLTAYRESHQGQISQKSLSDPKEQIPQFQKKGRGGGFGYGNGRRVRPSRPVPLLQLQKTGSDMRALFLGGSGSGSASSGTGVFLPRGGTSAPSESRKKLGKGCSPVLIPARVVQALQLHFEQMAATSGPKAGGFPPLRDVLVSNRDGMYSLQKRQSRKAVPANIQNEMTLPQEWTY